VTGERRAGTGRANPGTVERPCSGSPHPGRRRLRPLLRRAYCSFSARLGDPTAGV